MTNREAAREGALEYRTSLAAARIAGDYLRSRFRRRDRIVASAMRHDVKLDVDVETERLIIGAIRRVFPDHGFIGEECGDRCGGGGGAERSDPRGSGGPPPADRTWIVDPLDGTVNFAWGIPHFCTSIAFTRGGKTVSGVVCDPIRREVFSAFRDPRGGGSAFLNGRPLPPSGVSDLSDAVVAGGFFKAGGIKDGTRVFGKLSRKIMKLRFLGSAALDLCYLAAGRVNAYFQYEVHEWDVAAALLIAELSGKRFETRRRGAGGAFDVLAADPGIFDELKSAIGA